MFHSLVRSFQHKNQSNRIIFVESFLLQNHFEGAQKVIKSYKMFLRSARTATGLRHLNSFTLKSNKCFPQRIAILPNRELSIKPAEQLSPIAKTVDSTQPAAAESVCVFDVIVPALHRSIRKKSNSCFFFIPIPWFVQTKEAITDTFGRVHTYLRISLTERCNLRCMYCLCVLRRSLTVYVYRICK